MLYLLEVTYPSEHRDEVMKRRLDWKFPERVTVYERVLVIGQHKVIVIADVPDVEALIEMTGPYTDLAVINFSPIARWEDVKEDVKKEIGL
jgi:hypothetical protein